MCTRGVLGIKDNAMRIGIDVSSALTRERTGVEEYVYQLIKHITILPEARMHELLFYAPKKRTKMWHERKLPHLLRETSPDVFFSPSNPLPLRMPKSIQSVVTVHGLEWKRCPEAYMPWEKLYLSLRTRQTLKKADKIITVSKRSKDGINKFFGPIQKPIAVIYHGKPKDSPNFFFSNRNKKIVFIGRKDIRKNIRKMVEAFHMIKLYYSKPFSFSIIGPAGNDTYANRLKTETFGSATLESITSYISYSQKQKLFKSSDILMFVSQDEGFGMPILEAQTIGVPVVTSDFLREIGGGGALYCNPEDSRSIADAVLKLLQDDPYYRSMQKAAVDNSRRFSWEKCAKETLEFLIK